MTTILVFWFGLVIATISLAVYRKVLARTEDTGIHFAPEGGTLVQSQAALAGKLGAIDKWGKTLTVVTLAMGLAIGSFYVYEALRTIPL